MSESSLHHEVLVTPHMAGVINKFNEYRSITSEQKVVGCSFDIDAVIDQQAWMLAVYFADVLRGRV